MSGDLPSNSSPLALFVSENFIVGGVETLMARLGRFLVTQGWRVAIVTMRALPASRRLIPDGVTLHELKDDFDDLFSHRSACAKVRALGLDDVALIFTGDPIGSWVATLLSSALPEQPKVLCGVYQQEEYFYPPQRAFYRSSYGVYLRARNFDKSLSDASKVFPCDRVREIHGLDFKRSLDSSPILMIPVDGKMFAECNRRPNRFKIVSVGRITAWKTYNLYMVPVVRRLVDKGYPVQWDVYGDGDARAEMEKLVVEHGLSEHIHLKGTLEYCRMSAVMEDAGVFVGMGTSMLEAAFCGVPCVAAIARTNEPLTYGNLYDLPLACVGEQLEHPPGVPVEAAIERVFRLSDADYAAEMAKTRTYVEPYELQKVCNDFLRIAQNAQPAALSRVAAFIYRLHSRYLKWRSRRAAIVIPSLQATSASL